MKTEDLKSFLPENEPFTKERLRDFFSKNGSRLSDENLRVRINRLKAKEKIVAVGRGLYRLNDKKIFEPELSLSLKNLSGKIKKEFPFLNFILWSSTWLNELATLQLMRNILVIEVESGSEDAVFGKLKEDFPLRCFLNPTENEWENYKAEDENIVIKTMISESPYKLSEGMKVVRLEKILVDLYCDKFWKMIFSSETFNIYSEACKSYAINFSTLLSYAARRGKRDEIWNYIKSLEAVDEKTINLIEK
ncbi:MAG: hypothetical protein HYU69_07975 [Bacteroidetes bacterium]|nr:hypothetical protein [Bacteroidota bacterium]